MRNASKWHGRTSVRPGALEAFSLMGGQRHGEQVIVPRGKPEIVVANKVDSAELVGAGAGPAVYEFRRSVYREMVECSRRGELRVFYVSD